MPATSLDIAPIIRQAVMTSYSLLEAAKKRGITGDDLEYLLSDTIQSVIDAYRCDTDFQEPFNALAERIGPTDTARVFESFTLNGVVARWKDSFIALHPKTTDEEIITLKSTMGSAQGSTVKRIPGYLWAALLEGEPEPSEEVLITSSMINLQTAQNMSMLSQHTTRNHEERDTNNG